MPFRPFLLLIRKRLIATAILSLVVPLAAVLSGYVHPVPPDFFLCVLIGGYLGWSSTRNRAAETRFLFTRPISRLAVLLRPVIVAAFAIAVFHLASFLFLLGWRYLLPLSRSRLVGLHPSPLQVLAIFASSYWGYVSVGLMAYAMTASTRWLELIPKWLLTLVNFSTLFCLLPVVFWWLRLARRAGFEAVVEALFSPPSALLLAWPFVFAAEVLYCCWRIIQGIDELPEPGHSSAVVDLLEKIRELRAAREAR